MTDLQENLDVFEEETKEEAKAKTKEETKGETKDSKEADKAEGDDKEAEPPSAEEEKLVPIAALHDERTKRQATEEELKSYKSKYDQDDNEPDPAEDPEGFKEYTRKKAKHELIMTSRNTSRDKMVESHPDFTEKEDIFLVLAGSNPNLVTEMDESGNPAKFAYEKGKEWEDTQREKLKAQIVANAKDEVIEETSEEEGRKETALKVPDLTKAASVGANSDPAEIDNRDNLKDVFDDQRLPFS